MDEINYTTEHRKGQHLTSEERHIIEVRWNKDKRSIYGISKELERAYNTAFSAKRMKTNLPLLL